MKTIFLTNLFILLLVNLGYTQNLIPNGDFELGPQYSSGGWVVQIDEECTFTNLIGGPDFWNVLNGSPDRLVENEIYCDWDNSLAQSGNSFINLVYMESGKTTLIEPLKKDTLYQFSCYFKLNTFNGASNLPNRFFIKFSNTNDSIFSPFVNESFGWTFFDTVFVAKTDATDLEIWVRDFLQSGVYIDNLELTKVYNNGINENGITPFFFYPNPSNGKIYLKDLPNDLLEISIYNNLGQNVLEFSKGDLNLKALDLSNLENGKYYLQLITSSIIYNEQLIVNNQ